LGFVGIDERPPIQTGQDWFAGLSAAEQAAMFPSPAMYNAWQAGAIGWGDLVGSYESPVYGSMLSLPSLLGMLGDVAKEYYQ